MITQPIQDWGDAIFAALHECPQRLHHRDPVDRRRHRDHRHRLAHLQPAWRGSSESCWCAPEPTGCSPSTAVPSTAPSRERSSQGVVASEIVKWIIRFVFLVAAANVLGMPQVSLLLNQVLLWIPNLLVAAIILLVAPLIGRFLRGLIEVGAGNMGFTNAARSSGESRRAAVVAFAVLDRDRPARYRGRSAQHPVHRRRRRARARVRPGIRAWWPRRGQSNHGELVRGQPGCR